MKSSSLSSRLIVVATVLLLLAHCTSTRKQIAPGRVHVSLETDLGHILLAIDTVSAPLTSGNFLRYVDENRFVGASFYRTVTPDNQPDNDIRIEVIQGGIGFRESELRLPPIDHETTEMTGLRHLDGTLSMARSAPGTASSEIFICIGDQPSLDFGGMRNPDGQGFAAFGTVLDGMEVVRAIQARPANDQMLTDPVKIVSVARVKE